VFLQYLAIDALRKTLRPLFSFSYYSFIVMWWQGLIPATCDLAISLRPSEPFSWQLTNLFFLIRFKPYPWLSFPFC
jgi:hypothetical protein